MQRQETNKQKLHALKEIKAAQRGASYWDSWEDEEYYFMHENADDWYWKDWEDNFHSTTTRLVDGTKANLFVLRSDAERETIQNLIAATEYLKHKLEYFNY